MRNPETMTTSLIGTWMKGPEGFLNKIVTRPQLSRTGYYECDVMLYAPSLVFVEYLRNTQINHLKSITSREDMIAVMFCECLNSKEALRRYV